VGAFPVWRPNLDELDVDSAPASAFLILKSFKITPLQLSCRVPGRVLACLLLDGPVGKLGPAACSLSEAAPVHRLLLKGLILETGLRMTIDKLQTLVRYSSVLATYRSGGQTMSQPRQAGKGFRTGRVPDPKSGRESCT
jgi:hypothetical protein